MLLLLTLTTMSNPHDHPRNPRGISRPFQNRENKDPEPRSSYLRHFQDKERQEKNQIHNIFKDTDCNIENILNNSMGHLDKVIQGMDMPLESLSFQDILRQNGVLKDNLIKMKKILKDKLEAGLQRQKQELTEVLGNYISLITKLLQDKEALTHALQQNEPLKSRQHQYLHQIETLKEVNRKMKYQLIEKDKQIKIDQEKLEEFLTAIHHYQEDDIKEQERMQGMIQRIQELEAKNKSKEIPCLIPSSFADKKDAHDAKVQTLIELLETTQKSNRNLKQEIKSLQKSKQDLRQSFQEKIGIIQRENQQEFIEYQKAVNQTLYKKDGCIQRLNAVVESLKRK